MKKIILLFIVFYASANVFSQTNMKIRKTDSSIISIPISEIDSIYYETGSTSGTVTDIDGNVYPIVQIGTQVWMAENLKTTHYADGTAILLITDNTDWGNLGDNDKAYCYYENSNTNKDTYGALYTYAAAKDACPTGWHLPTDAEWTELENYIANDGHSGAEGTALKSLTGWASGGNGTDIYGFSALPGGYRSLSGHFNYLGYSGFWWSATEGGSDGAYYRSLGYSTAGVDHYDDNKSRGFSVRCVRD